MPEQNTCPSCNKEVPPPCLTKEVLRYGKAELAVEVPVFTCAGCDLHYTDCVAEGLRQAAVDKHLGLLN